MASGGVKHASKLTDVNANTNGIDRLPAKMNDMKIKDDKEMEATVIDGNGTEAGHIIGGKNGLPKQTISYMAEHVIGNGSFGVVLYGA